MKSFFTPSGTWSDQENAACKVRKWMAGLEESMFAWLCRVAAGDQSVVVDPIKIFHEAVENCKPSVATEIRKRGGRSYHVR